MAETRTEAPVSAVRSERRGACHIFTIARGTALNAIDADMIAILAEGYPRLARDPNIYVVVLKSADPKAFSAGGDVRALSGLARRDPAAARDWLAAEYRLNWLHECFSKPTVALIDGIVMGSGVGISAYATHRVAGSRYRFAMPETAIGFFPDVGAGHGLAWMPNFIGFYLGLTGQSIARADAYALGLVTHCIDAADYDAIEAALADSQPVDPLLDGRHVDPGPGELSARAQLVADCFSKPTVAGIMAALEAADRPGHPSEDRTFARSTLDVMSSRSPLAMAVTLRHLREAADLDLRLTLEACFRIGCRLLEMPDFHEGVRAVLVEKNGTPKWWPAHVADVTDDMLDDIFAPMPGGELHLPLRQQMQAMRV